MAERLSRWFANGIRSWPFLIVYALWTLTWFLGAGGAFGDHGPWLYWGVVTTALTEIDLIVYGIYQRHQSDRDELMQRNQLDTMRLLVALATEIKGDADEILEALEPPAAPSPVDQEVPSSQEVDSPR